MSIESRCFNTGIFAAAAGYSGLGSDSNGQFRIMVQSTSADLTAAVASASGAASIGILQNKPKQGEACDIMNIGISKVVIGTGGLTAGQQYMAASDGSAIPYVVAGGNVPLGRAVKAGNSGELGSVTIGMPQ